MSDTAHLKEPIACTAAERREFARLVREGFEGSDEGLPGRIRNAHRLAFQYAADGVLAAIAALKAPDERYRNDLFCKAAAPLAAADYPLELGWVFVVPAQRGNGIARRLCELLLAAVPSSSVFATTRPNNAAMNKILGSLGFSRAGNPYPHTRRDEELVLLVRDSPDRQQR